MADNYLENQYESYLARKAAMGKKTAKKKPIVKVQRLQSEAIEALKDIIAQPSFRMPFDIFREHLYSAEDLYKALTVLHLQSIFHPHTDCPQARQEARQEV